MEQYMKFSMSGEYMSGCSVLMYYRIPRILLSTGVGQIGW